MSDEFVKELQESARFADSRGYGGLCEKLIKAADAIEELQQTAEHYKGCSKDWYREACEYKQKLEKAKEKWEDLIYLADQANKVIESGENPSWISVKERLPENGTRCLVVRYDYVTNTPFVDLLWFDNSWWNRVNSGEYSVTHWMPLPEPPEESQNG